MTNYLFTNTDEAEAAQRMESLSALHDPMTFRALDERGIAAGWHCLEVGGGNGSVARRMAERVGPTGSVLVTDIEPRFIEQNVASLPDNIEIRKHDITKDTLPPEKFDLIHARLVLLWLPDRDAALDCMIDATKPGGWIVLEEYDSFLPDETVVTTDHRAAQLYTRARQAQHELMKARGADMTWGRRLHQCFSSKGLTHVGGFAIPDTRRGGGSGCRLFKANFNQIRKQAVELGLITDQDMAEVLRYLDDPSFTVLSPLMFTVWGQRQQTA